jgi:hypothetical protein
MQGIFGKRLDQEELYCSFDKRDVAEAMEDPNISKQLLVDLARRLEDFPDIRMIMLEPIVQNERQPRVTRSKIPTEQAVKHDSKQDFCNFVGLTEASQVKRGFDTATATVQSPMTAVKLKHSPAPTSTGTPKAAKRARAPRNPKSAPTPRTTAKAKASSRKRKHEQGTVTTSGRSKSTSNHYNLRGQSPRSVVEDVETTTSSEPQALSPKALFDKEQNLVVARIR